MVVLDQRVGDIIITTTGGEIQEGILNRMHIILIMVVVDATLLEDIGRKYISLPGKNIANRGRYFMDGGCYERYLCIP